MRTNGKCNNSKYSLRINIMRKFKFLLDLKSLGTILFIRPILEYGDVVWDNCTQQEKQDIEKSKLKQPEYLLARQN